MDSYCISPVRWDYGEREHGGRGGYQVGTWRCVLLKSDAMLYALRVILHTNFIPAANIQVQALYMLALRRSGT